MLARLANVNKDVQNTPGIVSDSNFLWLRSPGLPLLLRHSGWNLYPLVVHPFLKDLGTEEKREGFIF